MHQQDMFLSIAALIVGDTILIHNPPNTPNSESGVYVDVDGNKHIAIEITIISK